MPPAAASRKHVSFICRDKHGGITPTVFCSIISSPVIAADLGQKGLCDRIKLLESELRKVNTIGKYNVLVVSLILWTN